MAVSAPAEAELAARGAGRRRRRARSRGARPSPVGDLAQRVGEAGRVEAAGVGDDLHAALEREAEAVLDLADEGAGVAERRVLELVRPRISMVSSAR